MRAVEVRRVLRWHGQRRAPACRLLLVRRLVLVRRLLRLVLVLVRRLLPRRAPSQGHQVGFQPRGIRPPHARPHPAQIGPQRPVPIATAATGPPELISVVSAAVGGGNAWRGGARSKNRSESSKGTMICVRPHQQAKRAAIQYIMGRYLPSNVAEERSNSRSASTRRAS